MPTTKQTTMTLAFVAMLMTPIAQADEVVVIVNKDNVNVVDRAFVQRVYTGAIRGWPDGAPTVPLAQPDDSDANELFCTAVLGKSPATVRAIWSQNIFTGKGLPPKVAATDADMKRVVAGNKNALGYIHASQLDVSVKVVAK